jgi:hypothetical protein
MFIEQLTRAKEETRGGSDLFGQSDQIEVAPTPESFEICSDTLDQKISHENRQKVNLDIILNRLACQALTS